MNEKKFYIYRSRLLLSIFLLILIEPAYFLTIESIHRIYWVGKFLVFIVVCMMIMLTQKKPRGLVWISTFYGVILFSTIINSGSIQNCIGSICSSLTMCLIFVLWLDKNPDTLLNAFAVLEIYIYINLVTSRTLNENISSIYCKVILFTLCSFLVMGLTESLVSTELLYPMVVLGMKADKISNLPYQDKGVIILGKRIIWGRKG